MNRTDELRQHWDRKIDRWDSEAYVADASTSTMANLRKSIDARLQTALAALRPYVEGKSVLDVGCGAGRLALLSVQQLGASRAHGIDLSPRAVEIAKRLAGEAGLSDRITYEVGTVATADLPPADVTVGLGLLDWLDDPETDALLSGLHYRKYLLSYSEQDWSAAEIVHRFYLVYRLRLLGGKVRARHHTRREMLALLRRHDLMPCEIIAKPEMRFGRLVHNFSDLRPPVPKHN